MELPELDGASGVGRALGLNGAPKLLKLAGIQYKEGFFLFGCRVEGGWNNQGWMERPKCMEGSVLDISPKLPKWAGIQFNEGFFLFG